MSSCCCSLAGTAACRYCSNNPYAETPPPVRTSTVIVTDNVLIMGKKTNADRIRAMTDEELAQFMFTANGCPMWVSEYSCKEDKGCRGAMGACWLDWLKQEGEN